jgi:hypothetical protein
MIDRSHDRPGQTIYDWRHYLAVIQRKPGALRNVGANLLSRIICSGIKRQRAMPWMNIYK